MRKNVTGTDEKRGKIRRKRKHFVSLEQDKSERQLLSESLRKSNTNTLLKLFATYIVVGGMPDVVQTYVTTHDVGKVIQLQRSILELYRQDISKYSKSTEKIKIKTIFDSIASQLDDKNRRFFLNRIDENGRMNRYENAFLWLSDVGVALPSYNVTEPQPPLQLNEKRNLFKLFMGDTGLLCASCMENIQFELLQGNMEVNMGSILENVLAGERTGEIYLRGGSGGIVKSYPHFINKKIEL